MCGRIAGRRADARRCCQARCATTSQGILATPDSTYEWRSFGEHVTADAKSDWLYTFLLTAHLQNLTVYVRLNPSLSDCTVAYVTSGTL
ncbi:hypothetical protein CA223_14710 [Sphingomonas koreensis]|jgi:hypothetical protein|nr:hypothetical protein CA222_07720 [Sphingomonas koreensis]RSU29093.1 hypothetical protein BRX39_21110 [Sphingomonas koreensis]RSU37845.1 hypothetical protein CA223_14710 [Sphingomonas koreensis]RSU41639.1 hypothetical protein BRX38_10175 [Sphingomonas koreensis]RSU47334.1 hypothetical protein CA221_19175 [Sphingomonas koreensis]